MKTSWFKGLNDAEKEEIKSLFLSNARLRDRLKVILETKIESLRIASLSDDSYSNPNWSLKQADAVGYQRAIQEIINLMQ